MTRSAQTAASSSTWTNNGTVEFVQARSLRRVGPPFAAGNQLAFYGDIARPDQALAFSPEGRTLAVGSSTGNNGEVYLLDTRTHRVLANPISTRPATVDVLFSPDGRTLVTGEIVTGKSQTPPAEVIVNRSPVNAKERAKSAPLPHGRLIGYLVGGRELLVTTGETSSVLLNAHTLRRVGGPIDLGGAAAVSRDGKLAAFGHTSGSIVIYDLRTGKRATLRGHASAAITSLAFSPDGTTIASTAADGSVAAWDVATKSLKATFAGHTAAAEGPIFSPDGSTLYAGSDDGNLIAWDVHGTRRLGRPFRFAPTARPGEGSQQPLSNAATANAVSPDSSLFATSPGRDRITVWRARNEAIVGQLTGPTGTIRTIAFSPHGHLLAAAGDGPKIAIWNVARPKSARLLQRPGGASEATSAIALSPNDRLLATAEGDGNIWIYQLRTGRYTNATQAQGTLQDLDFSSDGRFLAAAGLAGQITVWDLRQNGLAQEINHGPLIFTLRFSPSGDTIATGDFSGDVDFWDANTGHQLPQQIASTGGSVSSLSFDPSGKRLMTTNGDGNIRLWDLPSDEPIGTPLPGASTGGSGTFFPNGKEVVAVFKNGTGVLWNVDPTGWNTQACKIANRNLTRAEWHAYLRNRHYSKTCP